MNGQENDWLAAILYSILPWIVVLGKVPWVGILVQLGVALLAVIILHHFGTAILVRLTAPFPYSRRLVYYGNRVGGVVVFLVIAQIILRNVSDSLAGIDIFRHINAIALIVAITWLGVLCVRAISHTIIELYPANTPNNLNARRIQTQTKVLARVVMGLFIVIGIGTALSTLPLFRQIGTSLLASAGLASLVVGFAAKPVLGNLLAGMQLALTQPIRLEDVVIVQNEWGWVEEITSTYVVVRIWDQRRMIVPLQWFIEHPFQNWTRTTSDILGTVMIWVDYRMPVGAMRKEAERICQRAPEWDGMLCKTEVTDASDRAKLVRILVSARDSSQCWDLRCRIREELVDFVQREYPEYLPRMRAEVSEQSAESEPESELSDTANNSGNRGNRVNRVNRGDVPQRDAAPAGIRRIAGKE